jgi:Spy/CpxP family protein refolding chaperone
MKKNIIIAAVSVAGTLAIIVLVMIVLHGFYGMRGYGHQGFYNAPNAAGMFDRTDRLKRKLNLTDEQVAKIDDINDRYYKEGRTVRDKIRPALENLQDAITADKVDIEKVRALMKAKNDYQTERAIVMIKHRTEIDSVLTKDQLAKMKHFRKGMFRGMMGSEIPGPENMGRGMMRYW